MSSTLFEPAGLPALGMGGIFFAPTIADLTAPAVAEFTLNLTCVPDAGWEPTYEESAGARMKYCSTSEYEAPGKGKWTGGTLTYEFDPQNPDDAVNYRHVIALAEGTRGFLGHRLGKPKTDELAAGDVLSRIYPVVFGKQVEVPLDPSSDGQVLQRQQRYFIVGEPLQDVEVVA